MKVGNLLDLVDIAIVAIENCFWFVTGSQITT